MSLGLMCWRVIVVVARAGGWEGWEKVRKRKLTVDFHLKKKKKKKKKK